MRARRRILTPFTPYNAAGLEKIRATGRWARRGRRRTAAPLEVTPAAARAGGLRGVRISPAFILSKFFRALGDPTRLRVLQLLSEGERSVGDLAAATGALQGRLSSHLACLRWCGLVTARRQGRQVYYGLSDGRVREILRLAEAFLEENAASVQMCQIIDAAQPGRGGKLAKEGDST